MKMPSVRAEGLRFGVVASAASVLMLIGSAVPASAARSADHHNHKDKSDAASMAWCGPKKASIALADGFGDNTWRLITRYSAVVEAAKCPRVTKYYYTNGEGTTGKAISDIESLVSEGVTAIVDFPDAGKAMLPALTKAYKAGTIVVPYRVFPGGRTRVNYTAYLTTTFVSAGKLWGQDVVGALHGKGEVTFLSGPPANSQGLEEYKGIESVFKHYPGIKLVGQSPYSVTTWTASKTSQVVASLLAKYPDIKAVITDYGTAIGGALKDWQTAGLKIPVIATEDANSLSCDYYSLKATNPTFKLFTVSSQTWMVEYAIRYAVALATGGKLPSTTVVPQENYENSVTGKPNMPVCHKTLPATAIDSSGLTNAEQLAALKGVIPSLTSLRKHPIHTIATTGISG